MNSKALKRTIKQLKGNPDRMFENNELSVPGYFLCYYIPGKRDTTVLSRLLLDFKNEGSLGVIDELCDWAYNELSQRNGRTDIIIRALRSNEMEATLKTPLDILGSKLARKLGAVYRPEILKKTRFTYPLKRIELEQRRAEIQNVCYLDCNHLSNGISVLIIDDIYTTGATVNEIIRSLRAMDLMMSVCFFTLGRTDFEPDKNKTVSLPEYFYKYAHKYPECFEDTEPIYLTTQSYKKQIELKHISNLSSL